MTLVDEAVRGKTIDRLRDDCVAILVKLMKCRRISIEDLANERGLSVRTVYRWINSFSYIMPIVVRSGVVIVGDNFEMQRLTQIKIFQPE